MLKDTDKLQVLPNPWLFLDADGEPQSVVPRTPGNGIGWIGARRDVKSGKFIISETPVTTTANAYVRSRINNGELIVVDREAAEGLQISFIEPEKVLAGYKATAISDYDAQHGDGAWARNDSARRETAKASEPSTAPTEPVKQDSPAPAKSARKPTATE